MTGRDIGLIWEIGDIETRMIDRTRVGVSSGYLAESDIGELAWNSLYYL